MTFTSFIATFWPLIAVEVIGIVVAPVAIVIALSRIDRKRQVKQMHRMRRAPHSQ